MANLGRRLAVVLSLLALFSVTASASQKGETPSCGLNRDSSHVGLCIHDLATSIAADGDITLHTRISNVSGTAIEGKTWWVLAPLGAGQPWDRAIYLSRVDLRQYPKGAYGPVNWDATVAVPSGFYDLAVVVHRVNADGSETHADARFVGPIYLAAPRVTPWLIRRQQGPGPAVVIFASQSQADGTLRNPFSRVVTIENQGNATKRWRSGRVGDRLMLRDSF